MRLFCIYWIFVLISSASSGIIFLIAACDRIPGPIPNHLKTQVVDNITISNVDESDGGILTTLNSLSSKVQLNLNDKTEKKKRYYNEHTEYKKKPQGALKEENGSEKEKNITTLAENLTQQPNLSQGISETGQSVVVTLVDTASLELQNLAEPHFSSGEYSKTSSNVTQSTKFVGFNSDKYIEKPQRSTSTSETASETASTASIKLATLDLNDTESVKSTTESPKDGKNDEIVVVRAEQKTADTDSKASSGDAQASDEIHKENEKTIKPGGEERVLSTSGELDQQTTTPRPKSSSGSAEDSAPIVLDGFVGSGNSEQHEDIPSFSEWTQKRLEEAEKKKTHPNASIQNPGTPGRNIGAMKVRSKNYASPDCGAKIVAVNPEARSARSVLVSTRDEYMLNTCTSKIWFVVELCEAIQAKKIELANFELFSSSPKDFTVFVSDRFPTREWSPVGQFTAKDERDIQSFTLHPHLFGKFIKVELHSHYGSEHFCPISLFRTYGTSEFEVLETETEVLESSESDDDDDDDTVLNNDNGDDTSKNLFGSARDAVIRIVKKAAEVLVQGSDSSSNNNTKNPKNTENNKQISFDNCITPRHIVLCKNCSDDGFRNVYELFSCRFSYLESLLKVTFISQTFYQSNLCEFYGISLSSPTITKDIVSNRKKPNKKTYFSNQSSISFLTSIFSPEYVVAFCNILVVKDHKLILNMTSDSASPEKLPKLSVTPVVGTTSSESVQNLHKLSTTCLHDCKSQETLAKDNKQSSSESPIKEEPPTTIPKNSRTLSPSEIIKISETIASQIKPTKTLNKENIKRESSMPMLEPSKDPTEETAQAVVGTTPSPLINSAITTSATEIIEKPSIVGLVVEPTAKLTTSTQLSTPTCEVSSNSESVLAKKDGEKLTQDPVPSASIKTEDKDEKPKDKESDEAKYNSQDQLSLDTLLSDLKYLEQDAPVQGSLSSHSTQSQTSSTTPQQKESVFLRLSNRIKALERNMSLSSQYLEELSRRYKKQVEEMQRSLERATVAMSDEFKKSEERDSKRLEEITVLKDVVSSLTNSVETLMYDKNSWKSKLSTFGQHIALIFIEITIFILIISYCRRSTDSDISITSKAVGNAIARRKSAESMSTTTSKQDNKKRRPSEIASRIISRSYTGLMIDEARKERRKQRKFKDASKRLSSNLELKDHYPRIVSPRRASIECSTKFQDGCNNDEDKKQNSVADCRLWLNELPFKNGGDDARANTLRKYREVTQDLSVDYINRRRLSIDNDITKNNFSPRGLSIFRSARLYSPSFMKTALRARSKREKPKNHETQSAQQLSDNWEWLSRTSESSKSEQDSQLNLNIFSDNININSHNGDITNNSSEFNKISESVTGENNILTPVKKVKKEGSLKKMVKKLF